MKGAVVPSNQGPGGQKHFVSPKKAGDFVYLRAQLPSDADFASNYEWVQAPAGGPQYQISGNKIGVPRDVPGKYPVTLRVKNGGATVDVMNVWIVWAKGTIEQAPSNPQFLRGSAKSIDDNTYPCVVFTGSASRSDLAITYKFRFDIQPASITDFLQDIPGLTGESDPNAPVPLPNVTHLFIPEFLSTGAPYKWDISQRMRIEILNPNGTLRGSMRADIRGLYNNQPKADDVVIDFPQGDGSEIIGNDDVEDSPQENNPYVEYNNPNRLNGTLNHAKGSLTFADSPAFSVLDDGNRKDGDTFVQDGRFADFVRLQLGAKWYLISDYLNWHHIMKVKYSNQQWIDNNSDTGPSPAN